jgi:hypothetical protein
LASILDELGCDEMAAHLYEFCSRNSREFGDKSSELKAALNLSELLSSRGDHSAACDRFHELLPLVIATGDSSMIVNCVENFAIALAGLQRYEQAAMAYGFAAAVRDRFEVATPEPVQPRLDHLVETLTENLPHPLAQVLIEAGSEVRMSEICRMLA